MIELVGAALITIVVFMLLYKVLYKDTFDSYKQNNPNLFNNGVVSCSKCGGTSIWMKKIGGAALIGSIYSHTCRTCGKELYKSTGS